MLHGRLINLTHVNGEDVAVENDEAGLEALGDLALAALKGRKRCRPRRVEQHGLRHRDGLPLYNVGDVIGLPRHGDFDRDEDVVRISPRCGRRVGGEAPALDLFVEAHD